MFFGPVQTPSSSSGYPVRCVGYRLQVEGFGQGVGFKSANTLNPKPSAYGAMNIPHSQEVLDEASQTFAALRHFRRWYRIDFGVFQKNPPPWADAYDKVASGFERRFRTPMAPSGRRFLALSTGYGFKSAGLQLYTPYLQNAQDTDFTFGGHFLFLGCPVSGREQGLYDLDVSLSEIQSCAFQDWEVPIHSTSALLSRCKSSQVRESP